MHRHIATGPSCKTGGLIVRSVYGDTSISGRRDVEHCETSGDSCFGGHHSRGGSHDIGNPSPCKTGGESAGVSKRLAIKLWQNKRRKRKKRLLCGREQRRRKRTERKRQERKEQRRIPVDLLGQRPKGLGEEQGEDGGETERVMSDRNKAPAQAVASVIKAELAAMTFSRMIQLCSTLQRTGCVLAWILFQLHEHRAEFKDSKLLATVVHLGARLQAGRRRSALPVRQGTMVTTVDFLLRHPLKECLKDDMVLTLARDCWLLMSCYACNTLMGWQGAVPRGVWGAHERLASQAVGMAVDRLLSHGAESPATFESVEKEIGHKRISYSGEEISTCHKLTVEQITPALPPEGHGGSINLVEYVSDFTRHMLFNPADCILKDDGRQLPKLQGKIHIAHGEEDKVAQLLVNRGICSWTPVDQVLRYRDEMVLNGLFGVEKSTRTDSGKPVLRVIMNLVPSNSVMVQLQGATNNLPSIMSWMSLVAEGSEEVRIWQSDMSNAFYLFSLPEVWKGCLAFNIIRSGISLGFNDSRDFALTCCVLPMGWLSSVSIMQELM